MSSGFVRQTTSSASPSSASNAVPVSNSRSRPGLSNQYQQQDNRSLYEILQENKAKKQAEFEQNVAERNQLHRLDDQEIAFLEGIKERERKRESDVRDEVERSLQEFRELRKAKQQVATKSDSKNRGPSPSRVEGKKDENGGNGDTTGGGNVSAVGLDLEMLKSRFKPASAATQDEEQTQNKKRQLDPDEITKEGRDMKVAKNLDKLLARRKNGQSRQLGNSLSTSIVKRKT
ncbi:N-terminal domain of NEFA-interacting nuclear protein NIP30-domain-containing protein [Lipomyces kononenkoae]